MSHETTVNKPLSKALVTKSVSMPHELFEQADAKVKSDQELDWSKYVRRLIRNDLAAIPDGNSKPLAA